MMYIVVESLLALVPATGANSLRILLVSELFPPSARTAVGQAMMFFSLGISSPIISLFPIINSIFPPIFYVPFVISQLFFGIYLYRHMPETRGRAVYDIIESLDRDVGFRAASVFEEKLPLIRDRARTVAVKRNSILNTPRTRALTFDHKFIPENPHS
uniref:MFS domain-containing protein n=1 Tax=Caenorhabditis tropicalis TaxID=1561998 RepID=A0A1I7UAE7_9PELO